MTAKQINTEVFFDNLRDQGISFFSGVPDSLLKQFCACVADRSQPTEHIIAANEGSAVAVAMGRQIGSGDLPLVYMQNSGLGNAINPILSLTDEMVYGIPMLLMIGWRGEILENGAQISDEPQHRKQGLVTLPMLDAMDIPFEIIEKNTNAAIQQATRLILKARSESKPVAMIVRRDSFTGYSHAKPQINWRAELTREQTIDEVIKCLPASAVLVATTGMASRELYELRESKAETHMRDFLTVGGMGHASQIALGLAMARPDLRVVCLDGDGAFLMHMGSVPFAAMQPNLTHIVLNNGCHDSVGGQPTLARELNLAKIAKSCGYRLSSRVSKMAKIKEAINSGIQSDGNSFIEILCKAGHRDDIGRPKDAPAENKNRFINFLRST